MKRNMLVAAGVALVLAFSLNNSWSQNDPPAPEVAQATAPSPAPAPAFQNNPGSNQFQRMPPPRFRQGRPAFARTLSDLRMMKTELQHLQGDFGGHKESAIEACDKAMQELAAVMKSLPPPPSPQRPIQPPSGATPPPPESAPPAPAAPPPPPQP
jgi:hypothetical protein